MSTIVVENLNINNQISFPSYTKTERDALSPSSGDIVFNSTSGHLEIYLDGIWKVLSSVNQE